MNQILLNKLAEWNGKHTQPLIDVYEGQQDYSAFFKDLIDIYITHSEHQTAITWLFKHHYDAKQTIDQEILNVLYLTCNELTEWEARLHTLQIMPHIFIPREAYPQVETFVRKCLEDPKPFVRAWAYQGFYEITRYTPEYISELKSLCEQALQEEKASVKARVRKIIEKL